MHKTCVEKNLDKAAKGFRLTKTTVGGGVVRVMGTILLPSLELGGSSTMIRRYQEPAMASRMKRSRSGCDSHGKSEGHEVGVSINALQN
jgi:hypothetical protein